MVARQMTMLRYCAPLWAIMGLLAGCQQPGGGEGVGFNYAQGPDMSQSGQISPLAGTLGGAGVGALRGRLLAGSHDNTAAILGGALDRRPCRQSRHQRASTSTRSSRRPPSTTSSSSWPSPSPSSPSRRP